MKAPQAPHVLLVVSGSIAAYKALDVARGLRAAGCVVTPLLTQGGAAFVTPCALGALCGQPVQGPGFGAETLGTAGQGPLKDHIALARAADVVLVCPASADFMARMAQGMADDLPSTVLLATRAPVLVAPAMNPQMWRHPATQANKALLEGRSVRFLGPSAGMVACGEEGEGRLLPPADIIVATLDCLAQQGLVAGSGQEGAPPCLPQATEQDLKGRRVLVTAGPTVEAIDPVRFISNHSSGKQGYAIVQALVARGAEVVLVSGPVALPCPAGATRMMVQSAQEMLTACQQALAAAAREGRPMDAAICTAAVSDWRVKSQSGRKIKKQGQQPPALELVENPDILATIAHLPSPERPPLVVGFAAETHDHLAAAQAKKARKGCDWLLLNDVSPQAPGGSAFGADTNKIVFLGPSAPQPWPSMGKDSVGQRLAAMMGAFFNAG
ncbi:bifunctional phosphopantothenoylcysteine decarboxylase/phosphopantothenate synthase [Formicincola oecophyllae]|uniref:Coenzyme A biosynthesis bifunctional protein CoaBC n=1 Tax=Formicincola oecophyllae TaxID=2558361 RepID=A0A4Y6UBB9_9PROT|nr:bifunctional phosphopantothenoylcysteine decarboxylase/phosphopantothenate synthase [Formicincola oecophyllae]QDH14230.1 bifunctional phosphopantothenoylcysteine decarboxylase/phosphopantothenate synthase [Formicincola oecophyllae]